MRKKNTVRIGAPLKPAPLLRPFERAYLHKDVQAVLRTRDGTAQRALLDFAACWTLLQPTSNPAAFRKLIGEQPVFAAQLLLSVVKARAQASQTQHERILMALQDAGGSNRCYAAVAAKLRVNLNAVEAAAGRERLRQLKALAYWKSIIVAGANGVSRIGEYGDTDTAVHIVIRHEKGLPIRL